MVTYKLNICDKLNWSTALVNFNLSCLNPIFVTTGIFSKTPQESPDNRDS